MYTNLHFYVLFPVGFQILNVAQSEGKHKCGDSLWHVGVKRDVLEASCCL